VISFNYDGHLNLVNKNAEPAQSMIQHRRISGQYRTEPTGEILPWYFLWSFNPSL